VILALSTNRAERADVGAVLADSSGREFVVARSTPHHGRFIVTFEGINGIDAAEALRDTPLVARPIDDPDALWIHELVGVQVMDAKGQVIGTVESVQANPASDLLVLADGGLIPLRFVVDSDPGVRVTVDVPDGLLDVN
jgi:16S rRNA processing protein RimM